MGRELGGQVRRTLGGGRQQPSAADVWDTATTEIPPEVGESPECQWCPICRAARRMRDGGPGIGGQLSGAGDAVASVVQDAIGALDSILTKAGGGDQRGAGSSSPQASSPPVSSAPASSPQASSAPASRPPASGKSGSAPAATGRGPAASKPDARRAGRTRPDGADRPAGGGSAQGGPSGGGAAGGGASAARDGDQQDRGASLAGDHGPGGWKPGDRLATEHVMDPDPWAGATDADDGKGGTGQPRTDGSASSSAPDDAS
jgi:hypothetical protein